MASACLLSPCARPSPVEAPAAADGAACVAVSLCPRGSMAPVYRVTDAGLAAECLRQIQELWNVRPAPARFPGPQPVSLMRADLPTLVRRRYFVTMKTRGTRYLLVALRLRGMYQIALVNRRCEVFVVPGLELPPENYPVVLDGELVQCDDGRWQFQVMDVVNVRGNRDAMRMPLRSRIVLYTHLVARRFRASPKGACPFALVAKSHYPWHRLRHLLHDVIPRLDFPIDGLVFTPDELPVRTGTHALLFKLKCGFEHTVDLLARLVSPARVELSVQGRLNHLGQLVNGAERFVLAQQALHELFTHPCDAQSKPRKSVCGGGAATNAPAPEQWDGRVLECAINLRRGTYEAVWDAAANAYLVRDDKGAPNSALTVEKTRQNMAENITHADLLELPTHPAYESALPSSAASARVQQLRREEERISERVEQLLKDVNLLDHEWYLERVNEHGGRGNSPAEICARVQQLRHALHSDAAAKTRGDARTHSEGRELVHFQRALDGRLREHLVAEVQRLMSAQPGAGAPAKRKRAAAGRRKKRLDWEQDADTDDEDERAEEEEEDEGREEEEVESRIQQRLQKRARGEAEEEDEEEEDASAAEEGIEDDGGETPAEEREDADEEAQNSEDARTDNETEGDTTEQCDTDFEEADRASGPSGPAGSAGPRRSSRALGRARARKR